MSVGAVATSAPARRRSSMTDARGREIDAALVRRCRGGDATAWVAIVERFSGYVYAIASRFGLGEDRAQDVYQEVFTRVFTSLKSLRDEAALKPWIAQVTRRVAIDRLRSEAHEPASLNAELLPQAERELAQVEEAMTVCRALDGLPAPYRDVVSRFFLQDQSYRTIGEALGIPAGTVASRISRGLSMLRETLEEVAPRLRLGDGEIRDRGAGARRATASRAPAACRMDPGGVRDPA